MNLDGKLMWNFCYRQGKLEFRMGPKTRAGGAKKVEPAEEGAGEVIEEPGRVRDEFYEQEEDGRGSRSRERDWHRRKEREEVPGQAGGRSPGVRGRQRERSRGPRSSSRGSSAWKSRTRSPRPPGPPRPAPGARREERQVGVRREGEDREGYRRGGYRREDDRQIGYRKGGDRREVYDRRSDRWEGSRSRSPRDLRERLGRKEDEMVKLRKEVMGMKSQMSAIETKNKTNSFAPMVKKNHNEQIKFCMEVKGSFEEIKCEVAKLFPNGVPEYSDLNAAVNRGETKVDFRCKLIAIADTSPLGWMAANEYAGCTFASNEADARKIEEAEKRAQRKMDRMKKEEGGWKTGGRVVGGGGGGGWVNNRRKSRSRSEEKASGGSKRKTRSRSKSKQRDSRECWVCNKQGHLSYLCPEKKKRRN